MPQAPSIALRVMSINDLKEIVALHSEVVRSLSDNRFLYARGSEFFEELIVSEGIVVGALLDDRLVAYGAVVLPGTLALQRNHALAHLDVDTSSLALGAGCGVHPDYRRAGLFKLLIEERTRQAFLKGCSHVTAVVSPRNGPSLRALHHLGHAAVGIHHDRDGENFLLLRPTATEFSKPRGTDVKIPLSDFEENLRFLRGKQSVGLPLYAGGEPVFAYVDPEQVKNHSFVGG